jgi:hypothetical protein
MSTYSTPVLYPKGDSCDLSCMDSNINTARPCKLWKLCTAQSVFRTAQRTVVQMRCAGAVLGTLHGQGTVWSSSTAVKLFSFV